MALVERGVPDARRRHLPIWGLNEWLQSNMFTVRYGHASIELPETHDRVGRRGDGICPEKFAMKTCPCGGRPAKFMKSAPVNRSAAAVPGIGRFSSNTGQHYDEVDGRRLLKGRLPFPIAIRRRPGSHAVQTAKVMIAFEEICLAERPDLVVVVGDVNSTMAASLVAAKLVIPIAHVEAGLRSFDRTMPEEVNRIVTDRLADLLLTPHVRQRQPLAEGTPRRRFICRQRDDRHAAAPSADGRPGGAFAAGSRQRRAYAVLTSTGRRCRPARTFVHSAAGSRDRGHNAGRVSVHSRTRNRLRNSVSVVSLTASS